MTYNLNISIKTNIETVKCTSLQSIFNDEDVTEFLTLCRQLKLNTGFISDANENCLGSYLVLDSLTEIEDQIYTRYFCLEIPNHINIKLFLEYIKIIKRIMVKEDISILFF